MVTFITMVTSITEVTSCRVKVSLSPECYYIITSPHPSPTPLMVLQWFMLCSCVLRSLLVYTSGHRRDVLLNQEAEVSSGAGLQLQGVCVWGGGCVWGCVVCVCGGVCGVCVCVCVCVCVYNCYPYVCEMNIFSQLITM